MGAGWPSFRRWRELLGAWPSADATPVLDVYEDKDAVVVRAELPGMEKDDVQVDVRGDVLTVRGEKKKEERIEERDYYCRERAYGAFSRSLQLPVEVQGDEASATFKNGVLEMRLPKTGQRSGVPCRSKSSSAPGPRGVFLAREPARR
jgi:HSP20 family protein